MYVATPFVKSNPFTMNSIASKTTVTLVNEEVALTNGHIFVPIPVKNPSDALRASLLMVFKHVSDIHVSIVEIIADKFKLDVDDIHNAIKEDPRWTDMLTNPLIHDLTAAAYDNAVPAPAPAATAKQTKTKAKTKLPTLTPEEKAENKAATKAQNKANREVKKQTKQTKETQQTAQTQPEEEELVF